MEEQNWLDCIEKYVLNENKIVTCKWLSRHLDIHVNISKRLLSTFVDKSNNDHLSVCYVVGGVMPDGSHRVLVTKQHNISNVKSLFKSVTTEHVYSIHKNGTIEDIKLLHGYSDAGLSHNNASKLGCSAIKCEDSKIRSETELRSSLSVNQNKPAENPVKKTGSDGKQQSNGTTNESKHISNNASSNTEKNDIKKSESSSPRKTSIAAMFASQKNVKRVENKEKIQKPSPKNKPKGLAAFLNKTSENKKFQQPVKSDKPVENKTSDLEEKNGVKDIYRESNENPTEFLETSNDVKKSKDLTAPINSNNTEIKQTRNSKKTKDSQKSGKKRKKNKNDDVQAKRRKRIVTISDSESSDEEECARSPSPVPREPTPPPPLSDEEETVTMSHSEKKARKKKLVEKTFLDDDGFLVIQKEYVFATSSEDEGTDIADKKLTETNASLETLKESQKSKNKETNSQELKNKIQDPVKKISPKKVKQASLMNFFGKKS